MDEFDLDRALVCVRTIEISWKRCMTLCAAVLEQINTSRFSRNEGVPCLGCFPKTSLTGRYSCNTAVVQVSPTDSREVWSPSGTAYPLYGCADFLREVSPFLGGVWQSQTHTAVSSLSLTEGRYYLLSIVYY